MRWPLAAAVFFFALSPRPLCAQSPSTVSTRIADRFDLPVGLDGKKQYFKARGFSSPQHPGEDWDGAGGGNTDLGDPVFAIGNGVVVYARDYRADWGNVVILRHVFVENGVPAYADSLYAHLNEISVSEGQALARGQKLGTIGGNHGMYPAHLHLEVRKNLQIGLFRTSFPRDLSAYWVPTAFIEAHRSLSGAGMMASVPINTFTVGPTGAAVAASTRGGPRFTTTPLPPPSSRATGTFKVDRFSDIRRD